MAQLKLHLFGAPCIERDGRRLSFQRRKALALLAYLSVQGRPQGREALATLLWPELDGPRARGNLRRELSLLRDALGDGVLGGNRVRLELDTGALWVDALVFREQVAAAAEQLERAGAVDERGAGALSTAVAMYNGDFLAGIQLADSTEFEEWHFQEAESLRHTLGWALGQLASWHMRQGAYGEAIAYARRLVGLDPFDEPAQRQLMRLYGLAGQWSAALRQYEQCARVLDTELGVAPAEETVALARLLKERRLDQSAVPDRQHGLRPPHGSWNPPVETTPFVGRERELEQLTELLAHPDVRLVTILGHGGLGKTRLALAYARRAARDFQDGVAYVTVAAGDTEDQLRAALASALGLQSGTADGSGGTLARRLADYLSRARMLLLLDNLDEASVAAGVLENLMRTTAHLKVLTTSRQRLRLVEEHLLTLRGPPLPEQPTADAGSLLAFPGIQLFVQSARRIYPDFTLSAEVAADVLRICQLVGGVPLALELAAARVNLFSLSAIADEIERNLNILESEARNVPQRQRSIVAVLEAAWEGLMPDDRVAFMRLAWFQGGWTRAAAEAVTGATLATLGHLSDQALIYFDAQQDRFRMHELPRQYAAAKCGEQGAEVEAVRERHAHFFLEWLAERAPNLTGPEQRTTLLEMRRELENLRAAWQWAAARDGWHPSAATLDGLGRFFELEGRYGEGLAAFALAADALRRASRAALAHALVWRGVFERSRGVSGDASLSESLELLAQPALADQDTRAVRAFALLEGGAGRFTMAEGETDEGYAESLRLYQALGDHHGAARALAALGRVAWSRGDITAANTHYRSSLALLRALGDERELTNVLVLLSAAARYQGALEEAQALAEEVLKLARRSEQRVSVAHGLASLGGARYLRGEFEQAQHDLLEAERAFTELGSAVDLAVIELRLGFVASALGDTDEARRWLGGNRERYHTADLAATAAFVDANLAALDLVEGDVATALATLTRAATVLRGVARPTALSFALNMLALAHWRSGARAAAQQAAREALSQAIFGDSYIALAPALALPALMLVEREAIQPATELYQALTLQPWIGRSRLYRTLMLRELEEQLPVAATARFVNIPGEPQQPLLRALAQRVLQLDVLWLE